MRPRGEIRIALASAAQQLLEERAAGTLPALQATDGRMVAGAWWRELAERSQVGYVAAKRTVRDMIRSGQLQAAGQTRVHCARRPAVILVPAQRAPDLFTPAPADQLGEALQAWARC